jgi:hypothetical protein
MVDKNGKSPTASPTSVTAEVTTPFEMHYDLPGSVEKITFQTKSSPTGSLVASSSDSAIVSNTEMGEAKILGTPGGGRKTWLAATSLYPFETPDSVYGGFCGNNNPNPSGETGAPGAPGVTGVTIPKNGTVQEASVVLPALYLTVWKGTSSKPETAISKPNVYVTDKNCKFSSKSIKRQLESDTGGHIVDPGLPFSSYEVCADNGIRFQKATTVSVESFTTGTTLNLYLASGSSGKC